MRWVGEASADFLSPVLAKSLGLAGPIDCVGKSPQPDAPANGNAHDSNAWHGRGAEAPILDHL